MDQDIADHVHAGARRIYVQPATFPDSVVGIDAVATRRSSSVPGYCYRSGVLKEVLVDDSPRAVIANSAEPDPFKLFATKIKFGIYTGGPAPPTDGQVFTTSINVLLQMIAFDTS